ncbi:hypothetical protein AB6A40_001367 [Gnathostoma spinigerum]|uniref:Uncharacterized protein n=1 Tax=Gnathostoma spinigerum TaxID=75299 RepID=A0ABD6E465_9BILA
MVKLYIPATLKRHFVTLCIVSIFSCLGYGAFLSAQFVRRISKEDNTLLHQEMEDYLYWKEQQQKRGEH